MTPNFFDEFIVGLFNEQTCVTAKQLSLIAGGKRTPSVLFNVEKNKLYTLFGLFPKLSVAEWERRVQSLLQKKLLITTEGSVSLAADGLKARASSIAEFPVSNDLNQLRYSATKPLFWNRLIFTTQVFSEYSYENKQYVPYLSSIENQRSLKKWLAKQDKPLRKLAENWQMELRALFQLLSAKEANFIADHFTGYAVSGSTSRQLQENYGLTMEHYIVFIDQLSYKISQVDEGEFPLLSSLWDHTHRDCEEGLSHSAKVSKQMLEQGKSIKEIAGRRKLKSNTIKEHILECVLITDWPHYKRYINASHYAACKDLFEEDTAVTFSKAKTQVEDLEFFTFRLIEIERSRYRG